MLASKENDYRNYGLIGTLVFHGALLALFFLMVFRGPNPPLDAGGDGGVVLNYGVVGEEGFGDVQTMAPANDSPNKEDSRPAAAAPEQAPQQQVIAQKAVEATPDRVITGFENSGVNIKEPEKPTKAEEKKEEVKAVEKPRSLYPGKSNVQTGGNGVAGSSNEATGNNNGDRPGKVGDQGDPSGTLDSKALYGKPGTGGMGNGSKLNMPGWAFDRPPKPNDNSSESGRIVFSIKVDEEGNITKCEAIETNVSPALTKLYRDAVFKSTLSPTNASGVASTGASGTVTFIISAR